MSIERIKSRFNLGHRRGGIELEDVEEKDANQSESSAVEAAQDDAQTGS